jgi:uncharacterized protein
MFTSSPVLRWRTYKTNYRLEGCTCLTCNKKYFPRVHLCTCFATNFEPFVFSGQGTLVTFTRIINPPTAFTFMDPYCIGLVQLDEGPRAMAQLSDVSFDELFIDMRVEAVLRKMHESGDKGIIHYGFKFVPSNIARAGAASRP